MRTMMGMGTPSKNKSIERMVYLLLRLPLENDAFPDSFSSSARLRVALSATDGCRVAAGEGTGQQRNEEPQGYFG